VFDCGIVKGGKSFLSIVLDEEEEGMIGCGLARNCVSGECLTADSTSSSSSSDV
jgi:hypothetical protein